MPIMTQTHIHSMLTAEMGIDGRLDRKAGQEINRLASNHSVNRDFVEVDYRYNESGDEAVLELSLISEGTYNRDAHDDALGELIDEMFDHGFDELELDFTIEEVELEEEDEEEE